MRTSIACLAAVLLVGGCAPAAAPTSPPSLGPSPSPTVDVVPATPSASPSSTPIATPTASPGAAAAIHEVRVDVERAFADTGSPEAYRAVVAGDTRLALRLYGTIAKASDGPVFLSPYSIATALSMVYAGARGETADQLAAALGATGNQAAWHAGRNVLDAVLVPDSVVAAEPGMIPLQLEPANALFAQDGFPIERPFLETMAAEYGAGVQTLDFATDSEAARLLINAWVAKQTHDRITALLQPRNVLPSIRLMLVNAVFFKAGWWTPFDPAATTSDAFTRLDGTTVRVPTMHAVIEADYGRGDGWQAIRVRYLGASMLIILPDRGAFAAVERGLTPARLAAIEASLERYVVTLSLPRWDDNERLDLVPALEALGIRDLFADADLGGVSSVPLAVGTVIHQANITVDETGTEAAAATAIGMDVSGGGPDKAVTLRADRPFIYLIQDDTASEILFMGRCVDPSAG